MNTSTSSGLGLAAAFLTAAPLAAQDFSTDDPVIEAIWTEGMESSAYLSAEDERVSRDVRAAPVDFTTGEPRPWPTCEDGARETNGRYR